MFPVFLFPFLFPLGSVTTVADQVTIEQGTLRGFQESSLNGRQFYSFLGIPFAEPPIGNLRFKDPLPAGSWNGTLEANETKPICMQLDFAKVFQEEYVAVGDEDCLYLNVYSPKPNNINAKLPVMVFIHGGGYSFGNGKDFPPDVLLNEDIVFVTIQYRLGPFGFISTDDSVIRGNYGLKDQVMALKWLQSNIAQFGGDPGRVTIFGESAGGGSVHLLMLSPWAKGLFHRAISQSGTSLCPWSLTRNSNRSALKLGDALNCSFTDSQQFLECVQEVDPTSIIEKHATFTKYDTNPEKMVPRVDGDFLPDEPIQLLKDGNYNKVDFISGITKDEGLFITKIPKRELLDALFSTEFDEAAQLVLDIQGEENSNLIGRKYFEHYLEGKKLNNNSFETLLDMFSDRYFGVCHDVTTKFHSNDTEMKTYRYQLDWKPQISFLSLLNINISENLVGHGDDLFYLFEGGVFFHQPFENPQDLKLREIFVKLWANFAATGDPTPDDSLGFKWNPATPSDFGQLRLTPEPYMSEFVNTKAIDFWLSVPMEENKLLRSSETCHILNDEF